jgi:pimeloyl-ACP methyl ester carboxylesterase
MEKVQSKDGTLIAYERSGDGPPLVLVHGILGSHTRWTTVRPLLEQHFTVYAIDRRGRGESGDAEEYSIEREFEDLAAIVDSIGGDVNVLGHSHGAFCTFGAALLTPNISGLVAYEPPPAPVAEGLIDQVQTALDANDREEAVTIIMRDGFNMSPEMLAQLRTSPIYPSRLDAVRTVPREYYATEEHQWEPERFKDFTSPAMLLLGGDSPPFNRVNAEYWHGILPNSRIVVLPGQQHLAFDTAPDLFVREVVSFLKGQP